MVFRPLLQEWELNTNLMDIGTSPTHGWWEGRRPYQNHLHDIQPVSWDLGSFTSSRYKFTFFVFLHKYINIESTHCQLDLIVDFYPRANRPELDISLSITFPNFHWNTPLHNFDWKSLYEDGYSMDQILQVFEHSFLEIPPITVYGNHTGALRMSFLHEDEFNDLYLTLKEYHRSKPQRQLAIGMMNCQGFIVSWSSFRASVLGGFYRLMAWLYSQDWTWYLKKGAEGAFWLLF